MISVAGGSTTVTAVSASKRVTAASLPDASHSSEPAAAAQQNSWLTTISDLYHMSKRVAINVSNAFVYKLLYM